MEAKKPLNSLNSWKCNKNDFRKCYVLTLFCTILKTGLKVKEQFSYFEGLSNYRSSGFLIINHSFWNASQYGHFCPAYMK